MTQLSEGTEVTPSIRLKRRLGAGGMGSVWVADHAALRTEVVVKFLADRLVEDTTSQARFAREASAAAQQFYVVMRRMPLADTEARLHLTS